MRKLICLVLVLYLAAVALAQAADLTGEWLRFDGKGRVRFAPCGTAICGTITWLKDNSSPARVGQRVFLNMKRTGESTWRGEAFSPEDGHSFSGTITLAGARLTARGCALAGLLCRSVIWNRFP